MGTIMTIVATFDVSDVFVEDWAQINCWSEHNIPVNYSSFKPKILCFFLFDIKEQISIVFHLSLSTCMRVMNKKTLESKASYLKLKRYQTYIHLLKQRRVRGGGVSSIILNSNCRHFYWTRSCKSQDWSKARCSSPRPERYRSTKT